jgi:DNA-binding XRE family transcriptional regulator
MRHKFAELKAEFSAEQRKRLDAEAEEMNREYVLAQIRTEVGLTQKDVATKLSISQPAYAAYEKADNMRIGTLRKIVTALGGVLSFHVELHGKDYSLQIPHRVPVG